LKKESLRPDHVAFATKLSRQGPRGKKDFFMSDLDEIKSPFLRKVLQRRGINDDQVTSLLIVERYQQQPDPTNSIVKLMLTAINRDMPLEAAIVRREVELGRALTDKEIEQEIREFQSKASRQAA
jgi:hypothetical protein